MFTKVIDPKKDGSAKFTNAGSCRDLVEYLRKEDEGKGIYQEFFFDHYNDKVDTHMVLRGIDDNAFQIARGEARFYSLVIAPRPEEMKHLGNDKAELKRYVRDTMDIYAKNFNGKNGQSKNLTGADLVYFAKLEDHRYYKGTDEEVLKGLAKQNDIVPGNNIHVHVIVSRRDKSLRHKISPLVNDKKLFSREGHRQKCCDHFNERYNYKGSGKELEKHLVMRDGTLDERQAYILKEHLEEKAMRQTAEPLAAGDNTPSFITDDFQLGDEIFDALSTLTDFSPEEQQEQQQQEAMMKKKKNRNNRPRL